jgi:hypothetical protein
MGCDQENVGFDPAFSLFNMESVKNSFGFLDLKTKTRAFKKLIVFIRFFVYNKINWQIFSVRYSRWIT